jgi:hypothetical protein
VKDASNVKSFLFSISALATASVMIAIAGMDGAASPGQWLQFEGRYACISFPALLIPLAHAAIPANWGDHVWQFVDANVSSCVVNLAGTCITDSIRSVYRNLEEL